MRTWTKACAIKPYQSLESIQTNEAIDTPGSCVGNSTAPAFRTHQPQICSRACSTIGASHRGMRSTTQPAMTSYWAPRCWTVQHPSHTFATLKLTITSEHGLAFRIPAIKIWAEIDRP